jgi:hypothetical protein
MRTHQVNQTLLKALQDSAEDGGVKVRYYPIFGQRDKYIDTITRSQPWLLGHGAWVVLVAKQSGGVALTNMELLPADAPVQVV